jgi:hypothetical protein
MLQLLGVGSIQAKLRVSQPGDPDEAEADRAAHQIVVATHAPRIQRKCACSGSATPCAKCEEEEVGTIHRSVASPLLRSSQLSLQRAPAGPAPANTPDQAGNPPQPSPTPSHAHPLVVEDDAKSVAPHQMRKSAFIALLRADACATADAALASVGRTTKSCPYIEKWLAFYEKQSSDHIERAILKYAPETAAARSAHEAIRLTVMRVQRAAMTWAKTGKVTDLPADLAGQIPGQGVLGAVQSFASSSVGGALLGFLGANKPEKSAADAPADKSPAPTVSRKPSGASAAAAPTHDAGAVRSQLGAGHSLDSRVQSQMSAAFGHDFSGVRVHTDSRATALSSDLNARAFTIGSEVAFASGEYQPGTPVGDALIAHELAHVVQQSAATQSSPMSKPADHSAGTTEHGGSQLENDADLSAVGAVASIWAGAKRGLADLRQNAIPRLRSGLKLQRCAQKNHDFEIRGVSNSPNPKAIFFDRDSSKLEKSQEPKIPGLKTPPAQDLTLYSFDSEDENSPPAAGLSLVKDRFNTVDKALRSAPTPHTGPQKQVLDTTSGVGNSDYREMRKVVVKPTGVGSGVPSCVGGGEIACATPNRFTTAQTRADSLLGTAIGKLTGPLTPTVAGLLDDRFGATGPTRASIATAVKANLTKLKTHIHTQMSPLGTSIGPGTPGHRCANECAGCQPGTVAYNEGTDATALMTLCDNSRGGFMNEPDLDSRATVLIHEGMHGITLAPVPALLPPPVIQGTTDFSYDTQRLIKFLDPKTALQNTDSYVLLVEQLSGLLVTVGPAVPDPASGAPLSPGPGGEREQVDRALGWLEGWLTWSEQEVSGVYDTVASTIKRGAWTNSYYQEAMGLLAPVFGLTLPASLPTDKDKFAVAAIHERFEKMFRTLFSHNAVAIERKTSGSTSWGKGPSRSLIVGPDFFSFPAGPTRNRAQLDLLLLKIIEANPDISSGARSKYVAVTDKLRKHFGGGSPP